MEPAEAAESLRVRCCVAGGGPAGMMAGLLLARAGVEVLVLEKHADFLRDFRGDTIHPSTLELMAELGLLEEFLRLPHQRVEEMGARFGDEFLPIADFRRLPARCKFVALMPQWDFLNFLADRARRYPTFRLRMRAEVVDLIEEGGRVAGLRARTPEGALEVRADLVIGADGRSSVVREKAGLAGVELGAPMDVLWMRLPRRPGDAWRTMFVVGYGHLFVVLERRDYYQCGFVVVKGSFADLKARGLAALREEIARVAPFFADRVDAVRDWEDVRLLTVEVDRLLKWTRPGLLCIGDAAHAMSPIGGVGINLAIQDAVAAANLLARPLRAGGVSEAQLARVQRRRELPTRMTQRLQLFLQRNVIRRILGAQGRMRAPLAARLLAALPFARRIPGRFVGLGFRPEHVRTPEVSA